MAAIDRPFAAERYTSVAIALHWTIGGLIIVNILFGLGHDLLKPLPVMSWHKAIGITVLVLSVARLGWRLGRRPPPLPATVPAWQRGSAHALHWLFYVAMLALPLSGWWFSSSGEKRWPLDWFGLFDIPYLPVARDPVATGLMHSAHEIMGLALIPLILMHVGAALMHHFGWRDAVLTRMAPVLARGRTS